MATAHAGRRLPALVQLFVLLSIAHRASAYPSVWEAYAAGTCAHPAATTYAGHEGAIVDATGEATFTLKDAATGSAVTQVCIGKKYEVQLALPSLAGQDPHMLLTSSQGRFCSVQGDIVKQCSDGGSVRGSAYAATTFKTLLNTCTVNAASVQLKTTYAIRGGAFRQVTLTVPVDTSCNTTCVDEACTSTDGGGGGGGGGDQTCSLACSCAYGVKFGASVCGYANTVRDVADVRAALAGGAPGFAAALDIYSNGKYAYKDDGVTRRTMAGVATANYGDEPYYKLAAAYFAKPRFLDDTFGAALRGDGEYANACCGVRAEAARAAARWYSMTYALHEVGAGYCYATGCNGRTVSPAVAADEILHGMALISGADDGDANGPQSTANPDTLFQGTAAASKYFCTMKRKDAQARINVATIDAFTNASAAAKAGNTAQLDAHYRSLERATVMRFLQYSLEPAAEASKKASNGAIKKADACRKSCLRESQLAAAKTYWKAVAPIVVRDQPSLAKQVNDILNGASFLKQYKPLAKLYRAIASGYTLDPKTMLAKCKA